jgi:hypothetical protein
VAALTDQVLLVDRVSLVVGEVVEEQLDVGVEAELPRAVGGDEAEDLHRAVGPNVQVPVEASNVDSSNFGSYWVDPTDSCKPGWF